MFMLQWELKIKKNMNNKNFIIQTIVCFLFFQSAIAQLLGGQIKPNINKITTNGTAFVTSYNCSTSSSGSMIVNNQITGSGVTQTITATVASIGTYNLSASANGVTFSATGTFTNIGNQNIVLIAAGTPQSSGTDTFTINTNPNCSFDRNTSIIIPTTITLAQNQSYRIISVYDTDFMPYSVPTSAASTSIVNADGTNESRLINIQGSLTTTGVTVQIPVTTTGSGTLPAFSTTTTILPSFTEDNTSRILSLNWLSQSYTTSTKFITATLKSTVGTLNVKKLDINEGIGSDYLGLLIGSFSYPYNNAGNFTNYDIRGIALIPDKMCGKTDNGGNSDTHWMFYLPVIAENGTIWLNNNLGAHYSNLLHASFNPANQSSSPSDYLSYGSLFQWGRKADGHELITYTSSANGSNVYSSTTSTSDNPTTPGFIASISGNWRSTYDENLWNYNSTNDPCPCGFRVPTTSEFNNLNNTINPINSIIKLSYAGLLNYPSPPTRQNLGIIGYYWTNTPILPYTYFEYISNSGNNTTQSMLRANGLSVRCIKN